ncbi:UNVERIFIED_CONTAM: Retrovirus-related Pol polyprotein from transposon RE1 [Sesamum radiatum]|uniref:Retrovirus-related Pol polyprotein from transposon RE1 n=1 Tax=Sesamum radiatum TaxID=300843 RepID=A0AAW2JX34_SESRA
MLDIDSEKWLEAMKSEMDSMSSNQVWTLVDRPKGVRPVGCKWVYKHKIGADGEVTTFKARLVQEDILNDLGDLYGSAGGFTVVGEEQKVSHLQRSIYGLKQASRSWNIRFNEVIRGYDFVKNDFDPCVYKKVSGSSVVFLVLYVDNILLIGNDIKMLGDKKAWLSTQFSMKDLCEASYILGIKIFRDRSKRILGITQNSYVEKVLTRYKACAGEAHSTAVKTILRYLRRTKDVFLVYSGGELILKALAMLASSRMMMMQNHSRDLYSSLTVVWWLGRVPSRIPQLIPPRKLST